MNQGNNLYPNMTPAEVDAWVRSGGVWQHRYGMVKVYDPETDPQAIAAKRAEARRMTEEQRARAREIAAELRASRPRPIGPSVAREQAQQARRQREREQRAPGTQPSARQLQRSGQIVRNVGAPSVSRYAPPLELLPPAPGYPLGVPRDVMAAELEALMRESAPPADVLRREAQVQLTRTRAGEHGTVAGFTAGCHCLDCTNAANEAAMLAQLVRRA